MRRVLLTVVALCVLAGTGFAQDAKKKRPERKGRGGAELAALAAQLIAKFDRNGDRSLNVQELTAALTAMRQRFAQQREGAGKKRPGGDFRKKRPSGDKKKPGAGEAAKRKKKDAE